MKANELRDMSAAELTKKLAELKEELFNCASSTRSTSLRIPAVSKPSKKTLPA